MSDLDNNLSAREQKLHYESLVTMVKWVAGLVTVIFSIGSGIIGCNVYQLNKNLREEAEEARKKVASVESKSLEVIEQLSRNVDLRIADIENRLQSQILNAANAQISEQLQGPRLEQLIYAQLRNNVVQNLDQLADESFTEAADDLTQYISAVTELSLVYQDFFISNLNSAVRVLDSIEYNSNDRRLRQIAKDYIQRSAIPEKVQIFGFKTNERYSNQIRKMYAEYSDLSDAELTKALKRNILTGNNIEKITKEFQALIDLTGPKLEVYEYSKLKQLKL